MIYKIHLLFLNQKCNKIIQMIPQRQVRHNLHYLFFQYYHDVNQIVRDNQTICVEDLAVANMVKNRKLAKSLSDCSFGEFLRQLKYKSEWNERELITIDRFFPSSKTCNKCKFVNQDLTLKDRVWTCSNCGSKLDRDINASENILEQGLIIYSGCGTQSESKEKREEALPLGEPTNHETSSSLVAR